MRNPQWILPLLLLATLLSVASNAQIGSPTQAGLFKPGAGLAVDPVTGVTSVTAPAGSTGYQYVTPATAQGIQAAINNATAGSTLYLNGVYDCSTAGYTILLNKSLKLIGEPGTKLDGGTTNSFLLKINSASDITLDGIDFTSSKTNDFNGLVTVNEEGAVNGLRVNNCRFYAPLGNYNLFTAVAYSEVTGTGVFHTDWEFNNNTFGPGGRCGQEFINHQWNGTYRFTNLRFNNNKYIDLGRAGDIGMGPSLSGEIQDVQMNNPYMDGVKWYGLELIGTKNVSVVNPTIKSSKTLANGAGTTAYNITDGGHTEGGNPGHLPQNIIITGGLVNVNGSPIQFYYAKDVVFLGGQWKGGGFINAQHGSGLKLFNINFECSGKPNIISLEDIQNSVIDGGTYSRVTATTGPFYQPINLFNNSSGNLMANLDIRTNGSPDNYYNNSQDYNNNYISGGSVSQNRWVNIFWNGTKVPDRLGTPKVTTVTGNYAINATNPDELVLGNGTLTVTLPDASLVSAPITIKNTGIGVVTINPLNNQSLDGATTRILPTQNSTLRLSPCTGNWCITNEGITSPFVPLFVFYGESNAAGATSTSGLSSSELLVRNSVKIINNTTLALESLQIGVNNYLDATGISSTMHGWEASLANATEGGKFYNNPVYLVKAGQEGAKVEDLAQGGIFWTKLTTRVDSMKAKIRQTGKIPVTYLIYSQGINNQIAGTSIAVWKTNTQALFKALRAKLGYVPIIATNFSSTYSTYNAAYADLQATDPFLFMVDVSGAGFQDSYHWDAAGMKLIGSRMWNIVVNQIGQNQAYQLSQTGALAGATPASSGTTTGSGSSTGIAGVTGVMGTAVVSGTSSCGGSYTTATYGNLLNATVGTGVQAGSYWVNNTSNTSSGGIVANNTVSAASCFDIVMQLDDQTTGNAVIMYLDDGIPDTYNGAGKNFTVGGIGAIGTTAYAFEGTVFYNLGTFTYPAKFRMKRSGTDLIYEISSNGGTSWTAVTPRTSAGKLSGHTTMYVKVLQNQAASNKALILVGK